MKIQNLSSVPREEVIACFLTAFDNYFVQLPVDVDYWKSRFFTSRVDWNLSFGMFEGKELVGFIINGIGYYRGKLTAYNTGTGVLPEHRGKAIVDQLYAHAIPQLKRKGIEKCLLEVICENERAIKVYERIGFAINRKLRTFSGVLPEDAPGEQFQKWYLSEVLKKGLYRPQHYSWDNSLEAVQILGEKVRTFRLGPEESPEAYLLMDLEGNIIQLESRSGNFLKLLFAAGALVKEVKLKNVDAGRKDLIDALEKLHFLNPVNQFEMEMFI